MSQNLVLQRQDTTNALTSVLDGLRRQDFGGDPVIAALRRFAPQPGRWAEFPDELHPKLVEVLRDRGFERLYSHQREAYEAAVEGKNTVVVTPTASGKTLCYNLPVLDLLLKNPDARALYLFPTKALSQDQLAELHGLVEAWAPTSAPSPTTAIPRKTRARPSAAEATSWSPTPTCCTRACCPTTRSG